MIYPNGHIDYMMYKNGGALIGVGKVSMPPIKYKNVTDAVVELGSNEWHDVAIYVAEQYFDSVTRREEKEQTRFEMSIRPIEVNHGTIAPASAADASGTYSVCKYTVYKAGKKVVDIDQFNQVHEVNGVDCAADVRRALGLMCSTTPGADRLPRRAKSL